MNDVNRFVSADSKFSTPTFSRYNTASQDIPSSTNTFNHSSAPRNTINNRDVESERDTLALSSYLLLRKRGKLPSSPGDFATQTQSTNHLHHNDISISRILASPLTPVELSKSAQPDISLDEDLPALFNTPLPAAHAPPPSSLTSTSATATARTAPRSNAAAMLRLLRSPQIPVQQTAAIDTSQAQVPPIPFISNHSGIAQSASDRLSSNGHMENEAAIFSNEPNEDDSIKISDAFLLAEELHRVLPPHRHSDASFLAANLSSSQIVDEIDHTIGHHHHHHQYSYNRGQTLTSTKPTPGKTTVSLPVQEAEQPEFAEDMDSTALKLLLRRALRDRDIFRQQAQLLQDEQLQRQQTYQQWQAQVQQYQHDRRQMNQQALPKLVWQLLKRYVARRQQQALHIWYRELIHGPQKLFWQQSNRQFLLHRARLNLLKCRQHVQHRYFARWERQLQVEDAVLHTRSVQVQQLVYVQHVFRHWRGRFQRNSLVHKHILHRLYVARVRAAFQQWQRFQLQQSHHAVLSAKRLYYLQRIGFVRRDRKRNILIQVRHAFESWHRQTRLQQRQWQLATRQLQRIYCSKYGSNPVSSAFHRWRRVSFVQYPKEQRILRLLLSYDQRCKEGVWKQWCCVVERRRAISVKLRRILLVRWWKSTVHRAFIRWRRQILLQQTSFYGNKHVESLRKLHLVRMLSRISTHRQLLWHGWQLWRRFHAHKTQFLQQQSRIGHWKKQCAALQHQVSQGASDTSVSQSTCLSLQQLLLHNKQTHAMQYLLYKYTLVREQYYINRAFHRWKDQCIQRKHKGEVSHLHKLCIRSHQKILAQHVTHLQERYRTRRSFHAWIRIKRKAHLLKRVFKQLWYQSLHQSFIKWSHLASKITQQQTQLRRCLIQSNKRTQQQCWQRWVRQVQAYQHNEALFTRWDRLTKRFQLRLALQQWQTYLSSHTSRQLTTAHKVQLDVFRVYHQHFARWKQYLLHSKLQKTQCRSLISHITQRFALAHQQRCFHHWKFRFYERPRKWQAFVHSLEHRSTAHLKVKLLAMWETWKAYVHQQVRTHVQDLETHVVLHKHLVHDLQHKFLLLQEEEAARIVQQSQQDLYITGVFNRLENYFETVHWRKQRVQRVWMQWKLWVKQRYVQKVYTVQRESQVLQKYFVYWHICYQKATLETRLGHRWQAARQRQVLQQVFAQWHNYVSKYRLHLSNWSAVCIRYWQLHVMRAFQLWKQGMYKMRQREIELQRSFLDQWRRITRQKKVATRVLWGCILQHRHKPTMREAWNRWRAMHVKTHASQQVQRIHYLVLHRYVVHWQRSQLRAVFTHWRRHYRLIPAVYARVVHILYTKQVQHAFQVWKHDVEHQKHVVAALRTLLSHYQSIRQRVVRRAFYRWCLRNGEARGLYLLKTQYRQWHKRDRQLQLLRHCLQHWRSTCVHRKYASPAPRSKMATSLMHVATKLNRFLNDVRDWAMSVRWSISALAHCRSLEGEEVHREISLMKERIGMESQEDRLHMLHLVQTFVSDIVNSRSTSSPSGRKSSSHAKHKHKKANSSSDADPRDGYDVSVYLVQNRESTVFAGVHASLMTHHQHGDLPTLSSNNNNNSHQQVEDIPSPTRESQNIRSAMFYNPVIHNLGSGPIGYCAQDKRVHCYVHPETDSSSKGSIPAAIYIPVLMHLPRPNPSTEPVGFNTYSINTNAGGFQQDNSFPTSSVGEPENGPMCMLVLQFLSRHVSQSMYEVLSLSLYQRYPVDCSAHGDNLPAVMNFCSREGMDWELFSSSSQSVRSVVQQLVTALQSVLQVYGAEYMHASPFSTTHSDHIATDIYVSDSSAFRDWCKESVQAMYSESVAADDSAASHTSTSKAFDPGRLLVPGGEKDKDKDKDNAATILDENRLQCLLIECCAGAIPTSCISVCNPKNTDRDRACNPTGAVPHMHRVQSALQLQHSLLRRFRHLARTVQPEQISHLQRMQRQLQTDLDEQTLTVQQLQETNKQLRSDNDQFRTWLLLAQEKFVELRRAQEQVSKVNQTLHERISDADEGGKRSLRKHILAVKGNNDNNDEEEEAVEVMDSDEDIWQTTK